MVRENLQVKEKWAELDRLKNTFAKRASEFLRNYFASLVDFMISDKSYFSQVFKDALTFFIISSYGNFKFLLIPWITTAWTTEET